MSIMEYNGGSVVAMKGKECVAIASDLRLGNQAVGLSRDHDKVHNYECSSNMLLTQRLALFFSRSSRSLIEYISVSLDWQLTLLHCMLSIQLVECISLLLTIPI